MLTPLCPRKSEFKKPALWGSSIPHGRPVSLDGYGVTWSVLSSTNVGISCGRRSFETESIRKWMRIPFGLRTAPTHLTTLYSRKMDSSCAGTWQLRRFMRPVRSQALWDVRKLSWMVHGQAPPICGLSRFFYPIMGKESDSANDKTAVHFSTLESMVFQFWRVWDDTSRSFSSNGLLPNLMLLY